MKKILLTLLALMFIASSAMAAEVDLNVDVVFAEPFTATVNSNTDFGTIYLGAGAEQISLQVATLLAGTAGGAGHADNAAVATAVTAMKAATTKMNRGTSGAVEETVSARVPGIIDIASNVASLDLSVALDAEVSLEDSLGTVPADPIKIKNIASNANKIKNLDLSTGQNRALLAVSPILEVPAGLKADTYTGTIKLQITVN